MGSICPQCCGEWVGPPGNDGAVAQIDKASPACLFILNCFNVRLNIIARRAIFLRMAAHGKIIDLRKLLAERFPHRPVPATTRRLITGLSFLDQAIGGGLPKEAITELISPRISAGSASLIHILLQAAHRNRYFLALIHLPQADWATRVYIICSGFVAPQLSMQSKQLICFCATGTSHW